MAPGGLPLCWRCRLAGLSRCQRLLALDQCIASRSHQCRIPSRQLRLIDLPEGQSVLILLLGRCSRGSRRKLLRS
uniref:Uncharacterized protein n=1 Tax=Arundo donax TaxID=35708 RepID=A0A0A9FW61_ARUDO